MNAPARRRVALVAGIAVLPFLALLAAVAAVAGTEAGARWTLERLTRFGVEVEGVSGRLLGPLELRGVAFRAPSMDVYADRAELDWAPRALGARRISVGQLRVEGLRVVLLEAPPTAEETPPAPPELPELDLPLAIDLASLRLDGIRIERPGAEPLDLGELRAALGFREGVVDLRSFTFRDPLLDLDLFGQIHLRDDYPLDLTLGWRAPIPGREELPPLSGEGRLSGSVAELSIHLALTDPGEIRAEGGLTGLPATPAWWARVAADDLDLDPLVPEPPLRRITFQADAAGEGDVLSATLGFGAEGDAFDRLTGSLSVRGEGGVFMLGELLVAAELPAGRADLSGQGTVATADGGLGELELEWSFEAPDLPLLAGRTELVATPTRVGSETRLRSPAEASLRADVDALDGELRWAALLDLPAFRLSEADPAWPAYRVGGTVTAGGDLARFEGEGRIEAEVEGEGYRIGVRARGELERPLLTLDGLTVEPESGGLLTVAGRLEPAGAAPLFDLAGEWRELVLSPGPAANGAPPPVLRSESGSFVLAGSTGSWGADLRATLRLDDLPEAELRLAGRGSTEAFRIEELTVAGAALQGRVTGQVGWSPVLAWELEGEGFEANLEALGTPTPGRISLDFSTEGALDEDGITASVTLPGGDWEADGRHLGARGAGSLAGEAVRVEFLEITSGPNRLELAGTLDELWAVAWEVEAPDLSRGAGVEGRLQGAGSVSGPREHPLVRGELRGEGIALPDGPVVAFVELDATLDLSDETTSTVRADLVAAPAPDAPAVRGTLLGEGSTASHRIDLAALLESEEQVALTLRGALLLPEREAPGDPDPSLPRWSGEVVGLDASLGLGGEWALRGPALLRASADALSLSPLCLSGDEAELCVEGGWSAGVGGSGEVRLEGMRLERFAEFLPPGLWIEGAVGAHASVTIDAEGVLAGAAEGGIEGGRIRHLAAGGTEEERDLDEVGFRASLGDDGALRGELALRTGDGSFAQATWNAGPEGPGGDRPLAGRITLEFHDRGLLAATSEELWNSQGVVQGDLSLSGTVEAPLLAGRFTLAEGAVEIPELGVRLEEIELLASDEGPDAWSFSGGMRSGPGGLTLSGTALLPRPERPGSVRAQVAGRDFQAMANSLGRVRVSPELALAADPSGIEVTGTVRVPWAELTPGEMEGMVATSPDVVVVGLDADETTRRAPPPGLTARLRVEMGDSVSFDGFGVTGRIEGTVTIVEEPGRLTTGQGELRLVDGTYTAARQRLTIERGRLVFPDRPIEDPGLDLRITRRTRDVLAVMEVRGTALEPEVVVFSDPVLSQADAMAYLLIGRPVRGTGERDGDLMDQVATSMGLAGGAALLDRIGPSLGLAEARIERGEEVTDAALVVGTYLTPRLFVSYGIGLFEEAVSTLRLRYELTDRWSFRTESGRETGADLLYSVER